MRLELVFVLASTSATVKVLVTLAYSVLVTVSRAGQLDSAKARPARGRRAKMADFILNDVESNCWDRYKKVGWYFEICKIESTT